MLLTMLKGKIHRAVVTQAELDYVGSITIDADLMGAAGLIEYEQVQVANINNGNRLKTYIIAGEAGSGTICLNGAAARYFDVGDKVIIMGYAQIKERAAKRWRPKVVFVDESNQITKVARYEQHGKLTAD